jgi:hypothetical protein
MGDKNKNNGIPVIKQNYPAFAPNALDQLSSQMLAGFGTPQQQAAPASNPFTPYLDKMFNDTQTKIVTASGKPMKGSGGFGGGGKGGDGGRFMGNGLSSDFENVLRQQDFMKQMEKNGFKLQSNGTYVKR